MVDRKKSMAPPRAADAPAATGAAPDPRLVRHPIGTPRGLSSSSGVMAVGAWLSERGIYPPQHASWSIQITLDGARHSATRVFAESIDTRFQIRIRPDDWGFYFCHAGRTTTVHVTDIARVQGHDDHQLLASTPPLRKIGGLIRDVEMRCRVFLERHQAVIDTSIPGSEPIIRAWVASL